MARFVLVHGTCHGAWCWRHVVPLLEELGHQTIAIDMPGHGDDRTIASQASLEGCVDAILAAIDAFGGKPAVLVGHSWGGVPISAAAEAAPDLVSHLIFLCAYIGQNELSLMDQRAAVGKTPISAAVIMSDDEQSYTIEPSKVAELFYHDCPSEAVAFAQKMLCPQPVIPQATKLDLSEKFGSVPKSYIQCLEDQTIPIDVQLKLSSEILPNQVYKLKTSHSPFFADPGALVSVLDSIVGK